MRSSICALPPPSSYSSYLETSPRPKPDFAAATRAAGKENLHFQDADDGDEAVPFNLADASADDWAAGAGPDSAPLSERRGAKKAAGAPESAVRRSMPAAAAAEFSQSYRAGGGLSAMRSSLRSSKEMKKPSAASSCATAAKPSAAKGRRVGSQSSVRRI
ncbi:hypothetical protein TRIUR3_20453 [Triticum urartu]|uniref:Uncharacterized protein n=1 Tax=Triticum urartu TaxID=4572 RepID=M7YTH3_TRIUA|nr:hypothetical protein TRIUR3_20453 [Triticum urartu]